MTLLENIDKAKLRKILLIVISALTLIALALLLVIIVISIAPTAHTKPNMEFKDYTVTDKDINTGTLIIADDDHPYSYEFADDELEVFGPYRDAHLSKDEGGIAINKYYMNSQSQMKLTKEAMVAAHSMLADAEAAIKEDSLCIDSTYGYDDESNGTRQEYNTASLIFLARIISSTAPNEKLSSSYAEWLDDNAVKYGFIESFEDAYRYVGEAHAKYIKDNKLSLADYIADLKKNTSSDKVLTVKDANGAEYAVYYASCKAGDTVKVPATEEYTVSGTNEGGVVITVKLSK